MTLIFSFYDNESREEEDDNEVCKIDEKKRASSKNFIRFNLQNEPQKMFAWD